MRFLWILTLVASLAVETMAESSRPSTEVDSNTASHTPGSVTVSRGGGEGTVGKPKLDAAKLAEIISSCNIGRVTDKK